MTRLLHFYKCPLCPASWYKTNLKSVRQDILWHIRSRHPYDYGDILEDLGYQIVITPNHSRKARVRGYHDLDLISI